MLHQLVPNPLAASEVDAAAATTAAAGYDDITADLASATAISALTDAQKKQLRYDPDLLNATSDDNVCQVRLTVTDAIWNDINHDNAIAIDLRPQGSGSGVGFDAVGGNADARPVRRLTKLVLGSDGTKCILFTFHGDSTFAAADVTAVAAPRRDSVLSAC